MAASGQKRSILARLSVIYGASRSEMAARLMLAWCADRPEPGRVCAARLAPRRP